jgi:hypothetical protein
MCLQATDWFTNNKLVYKQQIGLQTTNWFTNNKLVYKQQIGLQTTQQQSVFTAGNKHTQKLHFCF